MAEHDDHIDNAQILEENHSTLKMEIPENQHVCVSDPNIIFNTHRIMTTLLHEIKHRDPSSDGGAQEIERLWKMMEDLVH